MSCRDVDNPMLHRGDGPYAPLVLLRLKIRSSPHGRSGAWYRCEPPEAEQETAQPHAIWPMRGRNGGFDHEALAHVVVLRGVDGRRHSLGGGRSGGVCVACAARLRDDDGHDGLDDGSALGSTRLVAGFIIGYAATRRRGLSLVATRAPQTALASGIGAS